MSFDTRGGHNKKEIDEEFFDSWSPNMAYILGLIYADGSLIDVRKSSRTQYFSISSCDKCLLIKVKSALKSNHKISIRKAKMIFIKGKEYLRSDHYRLRVGSKKMYKSLISRGLSTKKSLTMKFPSMPNEYLSYFLRGYFDGDGCVYIRNFENTKSRLCVIFTNGSLDFLISLKEIFSDKFIVFGGGIYHGIGAYRLRYEKIDGIRILKYLYQNIELAPFLDRKYTKFQEFLYKEGL